MDSMICIKPPEWRNCNNNNNNNNNNDTQASCKVFDLDEQQLRQLTSGYQLSA
jgi:hypothetical protein